MFLFLGIICTWSCMMRHHYALVEPHVRWFQGVQPDGQHTLSAWFNSALLTIWRHLDTIYAKYLPTFNDKLQSCPHSRDAFENFQRNLPKKCVLVGKYVITQVGTSLLLCKDSLFCLPTGTQMHSPCGVPLVLPVCVPHSVIHCKISGVMSFDFRMQLSTLNLVCSNLQMCA